MAFNNDEMYFFLLSCLYNPDNVDNNKIITEYGLGQLLVEKFLNPFRKIFAGILDCIKGFWGLRCDNIFLYLVF